MVAHGPLQLKFVYNKKNLHVFVLLTGLPAHYLDMKVGDRAVQILGGLLMTTGELMCGLATDSWMAFVGTGVLTGKSLFAWMHRRLRVCEIFTS